MGGGGGGACSFSGLWFYFSFADPSQVHPVWGVLNIAIFMCVACCHCKQAAICIECHCCNAGWIFGDLIQPLLVFPIPNIDHTITACTAVPNLILAWCVYHETKTRITCLHWFPCRSFVQMHAEHMVCQNRTATGKLIVPHEAWHVACLQAKTIALSALQLVPILCCCY